MNHYDHKVVNLGLFNGQVMAVIVYSTYSFFSN